MPVILAQPSIPKSRSFIQMSKVEKRKFGSLNSEVSVVGFGGASVSGEGGGYGFGAISESDAVSLLQEAKDAGINLFDTAPIYGFGTSEVRMGKAFKGCRDEVFLVTKSGVYFDPAVAKPAVRIDNSPEITQSMLDESLKRLQTDYIDLYLVHWPDPKTDIRKTMEVLQKAKQESKIRAVGLCNTSQEDIQLASEVMNVDVVQAPFNLWDRKAERELFSTLRDKQIGFMAYGTFDQGMLTGKIKPDHKFDQHDLRAGARWQKKPRDRKFAAIDVLKGMVGEEVQPMVSLALGAVLDSDVTSTALCGVRNSKQLHSTLDAVGSRPDRAVVESAISRACEIVDEA